jgi:hypothetical protein
MAKHVPHRTVYEHLQDTQHDCGRACVQMVISSLVLGPPAGESPTQEQEDAVIPFEQDDLRQREQFPKDNTRVPSWRTHPDELKKLMTTAPELPGKLSNWGLSVNDSDGELFAALILALQNGMPAILNIYASDHWVVVVGVEVDDATSDLVYIEVFDPLPTLNGDGVHTYVDDCSRSNEGRTFADPQKYTVQQLGNLNLPIGDTPNPDGLIDYQGKFVALVHGGRRREDILSLASKLRQYPVQPGPLVNMASAAPAIDPQLIDAMREALQYKASSWRIPPLSALLEAPHDHAVRRVQDLNETLAPYHLLSLFSPTLNYGVVAVFDAAGRSPLHFRFTRDQRFKASLQKHPTEPLWWAHKGLPEPLSPYFPVARKVAGEKVIFERVFDDSVFELEV